MLSAAGFQAQFIGRKLWGKQRDICDAVDRRNGFRHHTTSVKGCHGSGKTFAASGIIPYELLADPQSIVLTIAPTLRQVKTFWNEIQSACEAMPVKFPELTTTGLRVTGENYALGFSSSKGVNAQGFHGKRVLIVKDEAIGIAPDLNDAIEGIRAAGDVTILELCNPTVPQGTPFENHTKLRGSTNCITISAFDTPNLAGLALETLLQLSEEELDYAPFPWLTRRRWVKEMFYKWGPTNPRFLSRVLGEFPMQATDSVFELAWIEKAGLPYEDEDFEKDMRANAHRLLIQVGLDIAADGEDETTMYARIGTYIVAFEAWAKSDPIVEALAFLNKLKNRFPGIRIIVLADIVGVGFHFARAIAREDFEVRGFRAGASPIDPVMYRNAKAEAYFAAREHMKSGDIHGLLDEDTRAQLSDVRYRELANGKVEIEHKDEARARGSSSPDRAEAMIMAFVKIVPSEIVIPINGYEEISPY